MLWHYCKLCGIPSTNLICNTCFQQLGRIPDLHCSKCLATFPAHTQSCINCREQDIYYDSLYCSFSYTHPLNKVLHELKYHRRSGYAWLLSYLLYLSLAELALDTYDAVIPIPLHPDKYNHRGFNQAQLLSQCLNLKHAKIRTDIIRRNLNTPPQSGSTLKQRRLNLTGAFSLNCRVDNMKILLVDDVVTTGITLNTVAMLLKRHNAAKVDACTLMRSIL